MTRVIIFQRKLPMAGDCQEVGSPVFHSVTGQGYPQVPATELPEAGSNDSLGWQVLLSLKRLSDVWQMLYFKLSKAAHGLNVHFLLLKIEVPPLEEQNVEYRDPSSHRAAFS